MCLRGTGPTEAFVLVGILRDAKVPKVLSNGAVVRRGLGEGAHDRAADALEPRRMEFEVVSEPLRSWSLASWSNGSVLSSPVGRTRLIVW